MRYNVLICSDSFKGSLTAFQACSGMASGVARWEGNLGEEHQVEYFKCPFGDGGDGTQDALKDGLSGSEVELQVSDPLGRLVKAKWLHAGDLAVVEMARASGLDFVYTPPGDEHDERDILLATSFGTGELIRNALDRNVRQLLICIGGSASNDGGAGAAQALGAVFYTAEGQVNGHIGGGMLETLTSVDLSGLDTRLRELDVQVACDVTNPLCGLEAGYFGASAQYGPQKGASEEQVPLLDAGLANLAKIVSQAGLEVDPDTPGAGAAGGFGYGAMAFFGGQLRRGVEIVIDMLDSSSGFRDKIQEADVVLTGEGMIDEQSAKDKVCVGVAKEVRRLRDADIPVVALVGDKGEGHEKCLELGISGIHSLVEKVGREAAFEHPGRSLATLTASILGNYIGQK